jgi:hypothetical protein
LTLLAEDLVDLALVRNLEVVVEFGVECLHGVEELSRVAPLRERLELDWSTLASLP